MHCPDRSREICSGRASSTRSIQMYHLFVSTPFLKNSCSQIVTVQRLHSTTLSAALEGDEMNFFMFSRLPVLLSKEIIQDQTIYKVALNSKLRLPNAGKFFLTFCHDWCTLYLFEISVGHFNNSDLSQVKIWDCFHLHMCSESLYCWLVLKSVVQ